MLLSAATLSGSGLNCHTDPYNFSGAKPTDTMAYKKSAQATSPGVEVMECVKNSVLKTLSALALRMKCGST